MQEDLDYKVYWEKQGVDQLCGVHCINSLLQGSSTIIVRPLLQLNNPCQYGIGT